MFGLERLLPFVSRNGSKDRFLRSPEVFGLGGFGGNFDSVFYRVKAPLLRPQANLELNSDRGGNRSRIDNAPLLNLTSPSRPMNANRSSDQSRPVNRQTEKA